jgi:hypothetical protein
MTNNLTLWDSVRTPDPARTKSFTRGGGFKGTATNATYLAQMATEKFGPCGIGWGFNIISEDIRDGAPLEGGFERVHVARVKLWYVWEGQRGEVEHIGQTTFCGKNKYGWFTDEEAPKKSVTDAFTKCLSLVGFAADIHLGLFDDNKYVTEAKRVHAGKRTTPSEPDLPPEYDTDTGEFDEEAPRASEPRLSAHAARKNGVWDELKAEADQCMTTEALVAWCKANVGRVQKMPAGWQTEFSEYVHDRMADLRSNLLMAG